MGTGSISRRSRWFYERLHLIEQYQGYFHILKEELDNIQAKSRKLREELINKQSEDEEDLDESSEEDEETLNKAEKDTLEILSLYEGIKLYLKMDDHSQIFGFNANNFQSIYSLVKPTSLKDKDVSIPLDLEYGFNHENLVEYFEDLAVLLSQSDKKLPIILTNLDHSVCLTYDKKSQLWHYVDTNDFARFKLENYHRILTSEELAKSIFTSFREDKFTLFNTQILTIQADEKFKTLCQEFAAKYPITEDQKAMRDHNNCSLLHLASQNGHDEKVKELANPQNVNVANHITGLTPLYIACQNGHLKSVKWLIKNKADVNLRRIDNGLTPLYVACQNGYLEVVRELIEKGATLDANAFYIACQNGDIDIVKEFIRKGADINARELAKGCTPLYIACQNGHLEIIEELIKKDVDVNARELANGCTPLYIACQNGESKMVLSLINVEKTDINSIQTANNLTGLHIACFEGHTEIVRLLLNSNRVKDIDLREVHGNSALALACLSLSTNDRKELFKSLLNKGANLAIKNNQGLTPLDLAFSKENFEVCADLLEEAKTRGYNPKLLMSNYNFQWAISLAKSNPSLNLLEYLEQASKNPCGFFNANQSANSPKNSERRAFKIK